MPKKYNYQEFKNDPRTYDPDGYLPRSKQALFNCIDNKKTSEAEISKAIEEMYTKGKPRSASYIKHKTKQAIKLFNRFSF